MRHLSYPIAGAENGYCGGNRTTRNLHMLARSSAAMISPVWNGCVLVLPGDTSELYNLQRFGVEWYQMLIHILMSSNKFGLWKVKNYDYILDSNVSMIGKIQWKHLNVGVNAIEYWCMDHMAWTWVSQETHCDHIQSLTFRLHFAPSLWTIPSIKPWNRINRARTLLLKSCRKYNELIYIWCVLKQQLIVAGYHITRLIRVTVTSTEHGSAWVLGWPAILLRMWK